MTTSELLKAVTLRFPQSDFRPIRQERLREAEASYGPLPPHLLEFFTTFGYGCVGDSQYMIHFLTDPADIYDPATARELSGIVIVGDDFAGMADAYNWKNAWQFGHIDEFGQFAPHERWKTFPEFLEWFILSDLHSSDA